MKKITVCFTGHRPTGLIKNNPYLEKNRKLYTKMVNNIYNYLENVYIKGYKRYISGGAQGFDQLAFWAVEKLKAQHSDVKNIIYIPFKGQELRWAEHGIFSQTEYRQMLTRADEIKICTENLDNTNYIDICIALDKRNRYMVNDSSLIIGQFNDDSWKLKNTKSGTANCLRYAMKHNIDTKVFDFRCEEMV